MSRSKKPVNPAAQKALEQLKLETAAEMGLSDYKNTYKGALTMVGLAVIWSAK